MFDVSSAALKKVLGTIMARSPCVQDISDLVWKSKLDMTRYNKYLEKYI